MTSDAQNHIYFGNLLRLTKERLSLIVSRSHHQRGIRDDEVGSKWGLCRFESQGRTTYGRRSRQKRSESIHLI